MAEVNHTAVDREEELTTKRPREELENSPASPIKRAKIDQDSLSDTKVEAAPDQSHCQYNGSSPEDVSSNGTEDTECKIKNPEGSKESASEKINKNSNTDISTQNGVDLTEKSDKEHITDEDGKNDSRNNFVQNATDQGEDLTTNKDSKKLTKASPAPSIGESENCENIVDAKNIDKDEDSNEKMDIDSKNDENKENNLDTDTSSAVGKDIDKKANYDPNENGPIDLSRPIDLSTNKEKNVSEPSSPDVIMLSDEESGDEFQNRLANGEILELSPEELEKMKVRISRLQNELRNEEAKLVLLKKIRQSQMMFQQQQQDLNSVSQGKIGAPRVGNAPPPLVRGPQSVSGRQHLTQMAPQLGRSSSQQLPQQRSSQGPPPLVMAPRGSPHQGTHRNLPGATPPNLVPGYRPIQPQQQQQTQQDNQTPAQRQAAAKLALRKQLEKTLLQIPPPKPPPPEMNFIPGLNSNEFILLVGLEEVVKYIVDNDRGRAADVKYVFNPFTCVQCKTDFTPVWKRDKPGSKNVICEQCVTTNQKRALKQEHTNRLKSAFVKALQQEQEIEQRMQSQQQSTASSASNMVSSSSSSSAPMNLTTSSYSKQPSADQLRQQQSFLQSHQQAAQLRIPQIGLQAFNPRLAFPYQVAYNAKPSDLQRQYLLDMIPSRGLPQSTLQWKS